MTTLVAFVVVVGVIVFVHELGHFLAAKLSGVRVEVFSLGFPPKAMSRKWGETEYQLAWIPLGGYVKMSGMADESRDDNFDPDDPRGFMRQTFPKKVFIIVSGVLMNVVLAWILYSLTTWQGGLSKLEGTTLTMVAEDSPAARAGLAVGDRIVAVGGTEVTDWGELTRIIRASPQRSLPIVWVRGDSMMSATVTPEPAAEFSLEKARTDTVGKIGIVGTLIIQPVGPFKSILYGAIQVAYTIRLNVVSLAALLSGNASIGDLTGPIGIAKLSGESARAGWLDFLSFIAMISVSIGFLNIMPIPMLDGGHLVFIFLEAALRRPIPTKVKEGIMKLGLAALLTLVIVVSYHDIIRVFFAQ